MSTGLLSQLDTYYTWLDEAQDPIRPDEIAARIDSPVYELAIPEQADRRSPWLVVVAAAASVLVLLGGVGLALSLNQSDPPAAAVPAEPLSLSVWSRVPHDEAVFGGAFMQSVAVGGPGLVAVGGSDRDGGPWEDNSDTDAVVWTSPDGITWSRVPHDEDVFGGEHDQLMNRVIAGGPGLVAVGWDGPGVLDDSPDMDAAVWTSVDGYTWSRVPHDEETFGGAWIESVTVGGPGLVAVGGTGGYNTDGDAAVWTSVDGITWSRVPHDEMVFGGEDSQFISDVTVGGPGLVAVGSDGGIGPWDHNTGTHAAVWTSVDGTAWSRVPNDDALLATGYNPAPMLAVTAGGPGLVAVGSDFWQEGPARTPVWTSVDGITWKRVPDDETVRGVMLDVTITGSSLVAVGCMCGASWNSVVWTSVDGITWTPVPDDDTALRRGAPAGRVFSAIGLAPYLVAVGSGGSSSDNGQAAVWVATVQE